MDVELYYLIYYLGYFEFTSFISTILNRKSSQNLFRKPISLNSILFINRLLFYFQMVNKIFKYKIMITYIYIFKL
jgi:hypothetical protein